jgi:hypothetical protein
MNPLTVEACAYTQFVATMRRGTVSRSRLGAQASPVDLRVRARLQSCQKHAPRSCGFSRCGSPTSGPEGHEVLVVPLAGAERRSALQRAGLAQLMPTHKRHFVPGDLQFLTSSTYRRAKLLESDRLLAAELRSAPAGAFPVEDAGAGRAGARAVSGGAKQTSCLLTGAGR